MKILIDKEDCLAFGIILGIVILFRLFCSGILEYKSAKEIKRLEARVENNIVRIAELERWYKDSETWQEEIRHYFLE